MESRRKREQSPLANASHSSATAISKPFKVGVYEFVGERGVIRATLETAGADKNNPGLIVGVWFTYTIVCLATAPIALVPALFAALFDILPLLSAGIEAHDPNTLDVEVEAASGTAAPDPALPANGLTQAPARAYAPGPQTQLNAIPVSASPVLAPANPVYGPADNREAIVQPPEDLQLLKAFAATPKHLYVVALSGAGKGVWLSNYIRWRKDYEPNLLVYWIDPKNDPKESGYFDQDWIRAYRFKAIDMFVEDLISELQAAFRGYLGFIAHLPVGHPVLLIVDECLMVQFNLDEHGRNKSERGILKTHVVSAASVGDSDNKHIVCVSQSPNAGDSGVSGGVLRGLRKIVLFRGDELDVLHQAKLCGAIDDLPSDADLRRLCRRSPRNRGIYLNGQYHSLPDLPNYSGYDRDCRRWIDPSKQPVNRLKKQLGEVATQIKPSLHHSSEMPEGQALMADEGLSEPGLDYAFNDLFADEKQVDTRRIDQQISELKKVKHLRADCMADLLQFIRDMAVNEAKAELKRGEITTSPWASRWKARGEVFSNCSSPEFEQFISTAIKASFLTTEDGKIYKITVS